CETACAGQDICQNGRCTAPCAGGMTACNDTCVDRQTDVANCGECGHACAAGQTCGDGACSCSDTSKVACGATCVDPKTDKAHCVAIAGCGVAAGYVGTSCLADGYCNDGACHICTTWSKGTLYTFPDITSNTPFFDIADINGDSRLDIALLKRDIGAVEIL